jgi:protein tyrosine/serine phosphatase
MPKWAWVILAAALVCVSVGGGVGMAQLRYSHPAHHFAVITEGVLYRSAQPASGHWPDVQRRCHMKTVISVREVNPQAKWFQEEEAFCRAKGIELIRLPLMERDFDEPLLRRFVALASDRSRQPVLVHCEAGSRRTGIAVAAYRVLVDHWDVPRALAEAQTLRFVPEQNVQYVQMLHHLTASTAPATAPAAQ